MTSKWNDISEAFRKLGEKRLPNWDNYLGFYSSWLGGFFREPWAMLIPMDEHGFHRGDGVFEAARIHERAYFDLDSHLERLKASAAAIGIELPKSLGEIREILLTLARLCQPENGVLRLYVTRGPGSFSPNPKDVVGHQIYAAITRMAPKNQALYDKGSRAFISRVPAKDPFWSKIKSCNYLPNVLMKKECLERGYDLAICVGPDGFLCEGSTENMMLITPDGEMIVPRFDYTLRGTTVRVVMRLAEDLVREGKLKGVRLGDVKKDDLLKAREAAFVGTTLAVLPMTSLDDQAIGDGKPGPISKELCVRLMKVMSSSKELRTPF